MKYFCAAISGYIFIILTAAAPTFEDFYQLFDELSEINLRMGEALKRGKDMATALKNSELKTSDDERDSIQNTIDVVEEGYRQIANRLTQNDFDYRSGDGGTDQGQDANNVTQQILNWGAYDTDVRVEEPFGAGPVDLVDSNSQNSYVNDPVDLIGKQQNKGTIVANKENVTATEENSGNEFDAEQNVDQVLNKTENSTDQWDDKTQSQYEKVLIPHPVDIIKDQVAYSKEANDSSFRNDGDHDHGQEMSAEKNYNGDEIVEESGGWFERTIDSIVDWFN